VSRAGASTALKDFEALGAALKRRAKEAAAEAARERARQAAEAAQRRQQARLRDEFTRAVGPVTRVPDKGLADLRRPRPAPIPVQRERDERQALQEALSDEVDIESLLLTDDGLSFRRPGIGPDVVTKLRRGHWAIQSQIDLHGLRRDEAREALSAHIREALRRGHRCVRVVHGKGLGSPGKMPVLKAKVQRWLVQKTEVQAFVQAPPVQGGAGALLVLLKGG